jgi:hypothetical protein
MSCPHQQTLGARVTAMCTRVVSETVVSETVVILSIVLTA